MEITLINVDTGAEFRFQFRTTRVSTSFQSAYTDVAVRGGATITDYSHDTPQAIRIPGQLFMEDATDEPERRLDALVDPMWRPVAGTTRKPEVILTGLGRRTYRGTVQSVEGVEYLNLDDDGRPREITFTLVFRVEVSQAGRSPVAGRRVGVA